MACSGELAAHVGTAAYRLRSIAAHSRLVRIARPRRSRLAQEGERTTMPLELEEPEDAQGQTQARARRAAARRRFSERHEKGLLIARERLTHLFQPDTFQEFGTFIRHTCTAFGMEDKDLPADGVIVGTGYVDGRQVAAFSQDFTVVAGTLGKMHAKKIVPGACELRAQERHAGRRLQGLRRRAHPGGRRRAVRLRRRLLPQRAAVGRRAADRRSSPVRAPAARRTRRR